jgi:predicted RNA-binding Zn-ribbon protein involved in translation (DUF1610 family)
MKFSISFLSFAVITSFFLMSMGCTPSTQKIRQWISDGKEQKVIELLNESVSKANQSDPTNPMKVVGNIVDAGIATNSSTVLDAVEIVGLSGKCSDIMMKTIYEHLATSNYQPQHLKELLSLYIDSDDNRYFVEPISICLRKVRPPLTEAPLWRNGGWCHVCWGYPPQKVSAVDVRKSITFCRHLHVPVLGVVENMSGFACPKCGEVTPIFRSGGGKALADEMGVPFLGSLPIDPQIAEACDAGQAFIQQHQSSPAAAILRGIIQPILNLDAPGGAFPEPLVLPRDREA